MSLVTFVCWLKLWCFRHKKQESATVRDDSPHPLETLLICTKQQNSFTHNRKLWGTAGIILWIWPSSMIKKILGRKETSSIPSYTALALRTEVGADEEPWNQGKVHGNHECRRNSKTINMLRASIVLTLGLKHLKCYQWSIGLI